MKLTGLILALITSSVATANVFSTDCRLRSNPRGAVAVFTAEYGDIEVGNGKFSVTFFDEEGRNLGSGDQLTIGWDIPEGWDHDFMYYGDVPRGSSTCEADFSGIDELGSEFERMDLDVKPYCMVNGSRIEVEMTASEDGIQTRSGDINIELTDGKGNRVGSTSLSVDEDTPIPYWSRTEVASGSARAGATLCYVTDLEDDLFTVDPEYVKVDCEIERNRAWLVIDSDTNADFRFDGRLEVKLYDASGDLVDEERMSVRGRHIFSSEDEYEMERVDSSIERCRIDPDQFYELVREYGT